MWVVVRLLNEAKLLPLALVQTALDAVSLLESLEGQDEEFCVVLVRQRREGDRRESDGEN